MRNIIQTLLTVDESNLCYPFNLINALLFAKCFLINSIILPYIHSFYFVFRTLIGDP